jgi:membrane-associated phospholipid phosphatase
MRDASPDTVTPGGAPAPLGARGAVSGPGAASAVSATGSAGRLPLAGSPWVMVAILVLSLLAYAAIATDVVHGGRLSEADTDVSTWVAYSMPSWAEWLARPFSWLGGIVGATLVVTAAVVWLVHRRDRLAAGLLIVVAVGSQLLATTGKNGYDRPRPTAGSPIDIPASFAFPSGHATTGIAVFGLLGLLAGAHLATRTHRALAIAAGFVLGALIGASRVVLNVHFVTDVLGGAALGLAWLAACLLAAALVTRARHRYPDAS